MNVRIRKTAVIVLAAFLALCVSAPSLAAEHKDMKKDKKDIADIWMIWVQHGQGQAFEAGMKKHVAWRKEAGEPFEWSVYQPVVGSHLNYYLIRSGNHAWADMDTESAWGRKSNAGEHYQKDVGQYAKHAEHYFSEYSEKYSHWVDSKDYRYYLVTTYHFNSGSGDAVREVMEKVKKVVSDAKWPYGYGVDFRIGGHGGMSFIIPMKNYAGMETPKPSMMELMTKALGSKEAARKFFNKFSSAVKKRTTTIYMYRPDLSTPK